MAQLVEQFKKAKQNIEPKEDAENAAKAHAEVREVLEADAELAEWGIDTVLIGSYARHVSIKRIRDADVFSKLPNLPRDVGPGDLLDKLHLVLVSEYGAARVTKQARSIKIEFADYDLSVDAVPARPCGAHWEIPSRDGGWEETNPEYLGELTSRMNKANDGHYVPTVKLIRQVRREHLGKRPSGFYFEILTFHAFDEGIPAVTAAEYFTKGLRGVVDRLRKAIDKGGLEDPTLQGVSIATRATDEQLEAAYARLSALATKTEQALISQDRCWAAKLFREVLGRTPDGDWVFPMPEDCEEVGRAKNLPIVIPGSRRIPPGDSRFA